MDTIITNINDQKILKIKRRHHQQLELLKLRHQQELSVIKKLSLDSSKPKSDNRNLISDLIKKLNDDNKKLSSYDKIGSHLTAIMIEPRKHDQLYKVVSMFMGKLDNSIKFILFHSEKNQEFIFELFYDEISQGKIKLVKLETDNLNANEYNRLLKQPFIYKHIPTMRFLLFQTDTYLNSQSKYKLENFMNFDYIGGESHGLGGLHGNGGLSLRNTVLSLKAIYSYGKKFSPDYPEDVFFYHNIKNLLGKVGTVTEMSKFCCNYNFINPYSSHPLFFHKLVPKIKYYQHIVNYCPKFRDICENKTDETSYPQLLHKVENKQQEEYLNSL